MRRLYTYRNMLPVHDLYRNLVRPWTKPAHAICALELAEDSNLTAVQVNVNRSPLGPGFTLYSTISGCMLETTAFASGLIIVTEPSALSTSTNLILVG